MAVPPITEDNILRHVNIDGYKLTTWDPNTRDDRGYHNVAYRLTSPSGETIFEGDDYSGPSAIDSDETVRGILGFLTLRPGDTDEDYFANYTTRQRQFAEREAESLSYWAMDERDYPEDFSGFQDIEPDHSTFNPRPMVGPERDKHLSTLENELENHSNECNNNTCDIDHAYKNGYTLWAAHLLNSATENSPEFNEAWSQLKPSREELNVERESLLSHPHYQCAGCDSVVWEEPETQPSCGNCGTRHDISQINRQKADDRLVQGNPDAWHMDRHGNINVKAGNYADNSLSNVTEPPVPKYTPPQPPKPKTPEPGDYEGTRERARLLELKEKRWSVSNLHKNIREKFGIPAPRKDPPPIPPAKLSDFGVPEAQPLVSEDEQRHNRIVKPADKPAVKPISVAEVHSKIFAKRELSLEKTSWNVKQNRKYKKNPETGELNQPLTYTDAQNRRIKYARSIGLNPVRSGRAYLSETGSRFPLADRNKLPFEGNFGVEHETAHAMMTPEGKTINQYQKWLSDHSKPKVDEEDFDDIDYDHEESVRDENIANQLEYKIDRRAGLDQEYKFRGRDEVSTYDNREPDEYEYNEKSGTVYTSPGRKDQIVNDGYKESAAQYAQKFDDGARFNRYGRIVEPTGIDAKINARAKQGSLAALKERLEAKKMGMKKSESLVKLEPNKNKMAQWMGRPIVHEDDAHELHSSAAMLQFGPDRMERTKAEDAAYDKYIKDRRQKAAGHHLQGMTIAQAAGDMEAARKHATLYKVHMKALGHSEFDRPPPEILDAIRGEPPKVYKFKAHKGDMFAVKDLHEQELEKAEVVDRLTNIYKAAKLFLEVNELAKSKRQKPKAPPAAENTPPRQYRRMYRCSQCDHLGPAEYDKEDDSRDYHHEHCPQYMFHSPEVEKADGDSVKRNPNYAALAKSDALAPRYIPHQNVRQLLGQDPDPEWHYYDYSYHLPASERKLGRMLIGARHASASSLASAAPRMYFRRGAEDPMIPRYRYQHLHNATPANGEYEVPSVARSFIDNALSEHVARIKADDLPVATQTDDPTQRWKMLETEETPETPQQSPMSLPRKRTQEETVAARPWKTSPQYGEEWDYSHHLPEEYRKRGWRLVSDRIPDRYGRVAQSVCLQTSETHPNGDYIHPWSVMWAEESSHGHNLRGDGNYQRHYTEDSYPGIRNAMENALSQHIDLYNSGQLRDIEGARARLLEVEDPVQGPANPEPIDPKLHTNHFGKRNTSLKTAGIWPHTKGIKANTLESWDYSHHLPETWKGHKLLIHKRPAELTSSPKTIMWSLHEPDNKVVTSGYVKPYHTSDTSPNTVRAFSLDGMRQFENHFPTELLGAIIRNPQTKLNYDTITYHSNALIHSIVRAAQQHHGYGEGGPRPSRMSLLEVDPPAKKTRITKRKVVLNKPELQKPTQYKTISEGHGHELFDYSHHLPGDLWKTHAIEISHNHNSAQPDYQITFAKKLKGGGTSNILAGYDTGRGWYSVGRDRTDVHNALVNAINEHHTRLFGRPGILTTRGGVVEQPPSPPKPEFESRFQALEVDPDAPVIRTPEREPIKATLPPPPPPKDKFNSRWEALELSEKSPGVKRKQVTCRCKVYHFPHRAGSHRRCKG